MNSLDVQKGEAPVSSSWQLRGKHQGRPETLEQKSLVRGAIFRKRFDREK
jgi:hypothetical protein